MESQEPSTNASSYNTYERDYLNPSIVEVTNNVTEHYIVMFNVSEGITKKKLNNYFPIKIISIQFILPPSIVITDKNSSPIINHPDFRYCGFTRIFYPDIVLPAKAEITVESGGDNTLRIVGERVAISPDA